MMPSRRRFVSMIIVLALSLTMLAVNLSYENRMIRQDDFLGICNSSCTSEKTRRTQNSHFNELIDRVTRRVETARIQARQLMLTKKAPESTNVAHEMQFISPITDENYFSNLSNFSNVKLLRILATMDGITRATNSGSFMIATNDCSLFDKLTYPAEPRCREDMRSLLIEQAFTPDVLALGMPRNKVVMDGDLFMLTYLHIVHDAVVMPEGDVYSYKVHMVPWRCKWSSKPAAAAKREAIYSYDEVFTIAQFWGGGFYHAVVEDIPRIALYVKFLQRHPQIKIHVHSKVSFVIHILEDLGFSRDRLVSSVVGARILYQPAGSPCGRGSFFQTQTFAIMSAQATMAFSQHPRNVIVLIRRSTKRWFNNHHAILDMLKDASSKYGYKVVVYSDRAIPELKCTKAIFHSAFLVVAPHGAGLANMVFSRPGTFIIEALCLGTMANGKANMCYRNLAQLLGHRYYSVIRSDGCFKTQPNDLRPAVEFVLEAYHHLDPGLC